MNHNKQKHKYLISIADVHCRASNPRLRIDNTYEALKKKLVFVVDTANKYHAGICCSGDLFDSSRVPWPILHDIRDILAECKYSVFCIAGNHDMSYHMTDLRSSPLSVLAWDNTIELLHNTEKNQIYGCGWNGVVTETEAVTLMIHKQVWESNPPPFIEEAVSAKEMFSLYPSFGYILSGDNHQSFVVRNGNRLLINPGTLLRNSKSLFDFKPALYLFDPYTFGKVKRIEIPIDPPDKVFDVYRIEKEKEQKLNTLKNTSELVSRLKETGNKPQFIPILLDLIKQEEVTAETKNIVLSLLNKTK